MISTLRASTIAAIFVFAASNARGAEPAQNNEQSADDLDLVKLLNVEVSTATKTAESLDEAPAVITVVTRDDIHAWGYRTLAEVLSHTVGFYLVNDQILPNIGVRGVTGGLGAESNVIKVMIDGRSVAYRTTSGNWLDIELVSLESVAQIEILRGPASALYGADAFLGVVNIITLKPEAVRPISSRVSVGVAKGNPSETFDIAGGTKTGKYDLLLGATGEYSNFSGMRLPSDSPAPILPSYVNNRRYAQNLERKALGLQGRLGYRDPAFGHLVLSAYGSGFERGGDFAHWAQLTNGTDTAGHARGTTVALKQLRINVDGLLHLDPKLDFAVQSTYFEGGVLPADRVEIASELFYVERNQSYHGIDTTAELRYFPFSRLNLITGVEAVYDQERIHTPRRVNTSTGESFDVSGAKSFRESLTNVGAFISSNIKVIDPWLKLTGGLRYDRHSEYGDQYSGRAGITTPLPGRLVAKLLYGNAFKAPSPYLLYATPLRPGDVVGNPKLNSQHIHTVEFQLSWTLSRFARLTSGVSYSWLLDKAEFTPQGINLTARNIAQQTSANWESRLELRHYDDYEFYTSFELVHSKRDLGEEGYAANLVGSRNVVYPSWISRSGLRFAVPSHPSVPLQLGVESFVVGPRRAADTSLVEHGSNLVFPTYFMLDTFVSTRAVYLYPGHETTFSLRARNLASSNATNPGFSGFEYPIDPSTVYFEICHTY
jgi:iron complex outermembrane receptor protein